MISHGQLGTAKIVPAAAEFRHRRVNGQKSLGGDCPEGNDDFGLDYGDLTHQKRRAGFAFIALGGPIPGRAALDDVCDINIFTLQAHGLNHVVQQLTSAADERFPLLVFIGAWGFADKHQIGAGIAYTEDDLLASLFMQDTAGAVTEVFANHAKRLGPISVRLRACRSKTFGYGSGSGLWHGFIGFGYGCCDRTAIEIINPEVVIKLKAFSQCLLELGIECRQHNDHEISRKRGGKGLGYGQDIQNIWRANRAAHKKLPEEPLTAKVAKKEPEGREKKNSSRFSVFQRGLRLAELDDLIQDALSDFPFGGFGNVDDFGVGDDSNGVTVSVEAHAFARDVVYDDGIERL